jgi:hypothetical protein
MGVDWKTIGWVEYQTTLAFWNVAHDPDAGKAPVDLGPLRRSLAAHTTH